MENPSTWKRAEKVISDAYQEWGRMMSAGAVGPSLPALIAARLRAAGLLDDEGEPELGWEALRNP